MNGNHEVTYLSKRVLRILASLFAALGIVVSLQVTTMAQEMGAFERKGGKFAESKEENRRRQTGPESTPTNVSRGDSTGDILPTNGVLQRGQRLVSKNGQYVAVYQTDGDVAVYGSGRLLWRSQTAGRDGDRLVMQADGNLIIYKGSTPVWATNTAGGGAAYLVMQDDGNLVIYKHGGGPLWASSAAGPASAPANVMARATPTSQQPTVQQPSAQRPGIQQLPAQPTAQPPTAQTKSAMTIAASPTQQSPQPPAQPAAPQSTVSQPSAQRSLIQRSPAQPAAPTTSATISAASPAQKAQQAVQQPVTFSTWEALWRHIWAKANRTGRIRAASTVLYDQACQGDMNVIAAIVESYIRAVRDRKYGDAVRYMSEFQDKTLCLTEEAAKGVDAALAFFSALAAEQLPQAEARTAVQGAFNLSLLAFDQVKYTEQSWWPVAMYVGGDTIAPLLANYPDAELGLWVFDLETGRLEQYLDKRASLVEHLRKQPGYLEKQPCPMEIIIASGNFDCVTGKKVKGQLKKGGGGGTNKGGVPGLGGFGDFSNASCIVRVANTMGMRGMHACMDKALAGSPFGGGSFDPSISVRDPQFSTPNPQCTKREEDLPPAPLIPKPKHSEPKKPEHKQKKDPLIPKDKDWLSRAEKKQAQERSDVKNVNEVAESLVDSCGGGDMAACGTITEFEKGKKGQYSNNPQSGAQKAAINDAVRRLPDGAAKKKAQEAQCKGGNTQACVDLAFNDGDNDKKKDDKKKEGHPGPEPDGGPDGGGCGSNAAAWARAMYQCVAGPPLDQQLKPFSPGGGTGPIARYPGEGGEGGPGGGQSAGFLACMQQGGSLVRAGAADKKCTQVQCANDGTPCPCEPSGFQHQADRTPNERAQGPNRVCNPGEGGSCPKKSGESGGSESGGLGGREPVGPLPPTNSQGGGPPPGGIPK